MTAYPQLINQRQNEPAFLDLLYAADVAHARAYRWERLRWLLIVISAILAMAASYRPSLGGALSITGLFVAVLTTVVLPWVSGGSTKEAALMQESFDVDLLGLPWNDQVGWRPLSERVHELAGRFLGDRECKRDWYVDVSGLPRAYGVLLCQRENLVWDFRQRRGWGLRVAAATVIWLVLGIVVGLLVDWTVRHLFLRWFVPSAALLTAGYQESRTHLRSAQEKEDTAFRVESRLAVAPSGDPDASQHRELLEVARELQDRLAASRTQTARVPQWFYRRRRKAEESCAHEAADQLRHRLLVP